MSEPLTFYQQEKKRFEEQRGLLRKKINIFSILRLGLFLLTFLAVYYAYPNKQLLAIVLTSCIIGFVFLVLRHQFLVAERKLCEQLISINEVEIDALNGE